jgi:Uma2 family endonuclease
MEQLIPPKTSRITVEDYLRMENASETKHEFRHGRIISMAGATFEHVSIATNLTRQIGNQLVGTSCRVLGSDLRVRITGTSNYCYPDVMVVCGPPVFDDSDKKLHLLNPKIVIEVSSPSTVANDRGDKFYDYMSIDSLQEYVLVAQDRPRVDTFYRQSDGIWAIGPSADGISSSVTFRSLRISLALKEIYEGVEFPDADAGAAPPV